MQTFVKNFAKTVDETKKTEIETSLKALVNAETALWPTFWQPQISLILIIIMIQYLLILKMRTSSDIIYHIRDHTLLFDVCKYVNYLYMSKQVLELF